MLAISARALFNCLKFIPCPFLYLLNFGKTLIVVLSTKWESKLGKLTLISAGFLNKCQYMGEMKSLIVV